MALGSLLPGMALLALVGGLVAVVALADAGPHLGSVEPSLVERVNQVLVANGALESQHLDVRAMRDQQVAARRHAPVAGMALLACLARRWLEQVRIVGALQQLRVEGRYRLHGE